MKSRFFLQPSFALYLLVLNIVGFTGGCQWVNDTTGSVNGKPEPGPSGSTLESKNIHLMLGNPSGASSNPNNRDNYLLLKRTFAISYNDSRGTANWVSWKTTKNDIGDSLERPDFRPDPLLPGNFARINATDYSGSGYQRGHLVPSADRFGDPEANLETFMMTNIVPQTGDLNQYPWAKFENYVRYNARRNSDVYQIAGIYGDNGRIRSKVTVPTNCWKIVIILPAGSEIADINENTRILAVDMPNTKGIAKNRWQQYQTTVRAIEQKTGYNFLSRLPEGLQEILENRVGDK